MFCTADGIVRRHNLLELLPKLSNIAMASLLSHTAEKLDALVDVAGEAPVRERARKRKLRA